MSSLYSVFVSLPALWPEIVPLPTWPGLSSLEKTFSRVENQLERNVKILEERLASVLSDDGPDKAQDIENILRNWCSTQTAPSLVSFCFYAADKLSLTFPEELQKPLLMGALLGCIENHPAYHSHIHYAKVVLQMLRLLQENQKSSAPLNAHQTTLLLLATCIHDLGHDGRSNTISGTHHPGRLEYQSVVFATPYLKQAGLRDEDLSIIEHLILCTDVTPLRSIDTPSPAEQMKQAYRIHFEGEEDGKLEGPFANPALTFMALLLHEADIATSAGITYDVTKYETALYRQELTGEDAEVQPRHIVDFMNQIGLSALLSDESQKLYSANADTIYAQALKDLENGNYPYPPLKK